MKTKSFFPLALGAGFILTSPAIAQTIEVTSTGVGMGTSTPRDILEINGGGSAATIRFANNATGNDFVRAATNGNLELGTYYSHAVGIYTNNAERIRIDSLGSVGIGAPSPQERLEVAGNILLNPADKHLKIFSNTEGTDAIVFARSDNSNQSSIATTGFGKSILFKVGGTEMVRFRNDGNVGIGNTNPTRKFSVQSSATTHTEIADFFAPSLSSGNIVYSLIGRAAGNAQAGLWGYQYESTSSNSFMWFCNYGDAHSTGGITIRSGGNVGIGVANPSYRLHISGSVRATSFIADVNTYSDFVFKPGYRLASLSEVETHINEKGHLPDIPSEAEARASGINLADMQAKLLQKVEEVTLHLVAHEKELARLRAENATLTQKVSDLEKR